MMKITAWVVFIAGTLVVMFGSFGIRAAVIVGGILMSGGFVAIVLGSH